MLYVGAYPGSCYNKKKGKPKSLKCSSFTGNLAILVTVFRQEVNLYLASLISKLCEFLPKNIKIHVFQHAQVQPFALSDVVIIKFPISGNLYWAPEQKYRKVKYHSQTGPPGVTLAVNRKTFATPSIEMCKIVKFRNQI